MHNMQKDMITEYESPIPLTDWLGSFISKHLPLSTSDLNRMVDELIGVHSRDFEMIDFYSSYHMPYRWTSFEESIAFKISLLARIFTPTFRTNYSPFEPATRRSEGRGILKNPSLTGQSSTGSMNSSSSEGEPSSEDDDSLLETSNQQSTTTTTEESEMSSKQVTFRSMFPTMVEIYQSSIRPPSLVDMAKYKQYVRMGTILTSNAAMKTYNPKKPLHNRHKRLVQLASPTEYGTDNYQQVQTPVVNPKSIKIYEKYVTLPDKVYNRSPSVFDFDVITNYFDQNYRF